MYAQEQPSVKTGQVYIFELVTPGCCVKYPKWAEKDENRKAMESTNQWDNEFLTLPFANKNLEGGCLERRQ